MLLSGIRINKSTFMPKMGFDILILRKRKVSKGVEWFYLAHRSKDDGFWISEHDLIKNYERL